MEEETRGEETMRLVAANIVICVLFLFSEERSMTTLIHCLKGKSRKIQQKFALFFGFCVWCCCEYFYTEVNVRQCWSETRELFKSTLGEQFL